MRGTSGLHFLMRHSIHCDTTVFTVGLSLTNQYFPLAGGLLFHDSHEPPSRGSAEQSVEPQGSGRPILQASIHPWRRLQLHRFDRPRAASYACLKMVRE